MKKSAFLLVTSDSPSCHLAIIALTLLEALHRELHTRHPSARRDPNRASRIFSHISLGAPGTCPPSCPAAGTCPPSYQQFWRSSEEAQSKIEGGILKLLPIFLLLVFFYSFVLPFLVNILFQINQFSQLSGYLNPNREIQHLPSTVLPGPGGRGLPPATLPAQDRYPSCPPPDSRGRGYLGNLKSLSLQLPIWAE